MYTLVIKYTKENRIHMADFKTREQALSIAESVYYQQATGVSMDLLSPPTEERSGREFETLRRKDFDPNA